MKEQHAVIWHTEDTIEPCIVLVDVLDTFEEAQKIMKACYYENLASMTKHMRDMGCTTTDINNHIVESWCVDDNAHVSWPGTNPSPYWYIASTK